MTRSDIITATKANRLYWLGRYEMRVYLTLHQYSKCYDLMIDGSPEEYKAFWQKLDVAGAYKTTPEFIVGMLYDESNPSTVISAQRFAMDNAMMLREDIMSETLSYLEISMALLKKLKATSTTIISELQPVIDWSMAFWGSAEHRVNNPKALSLMMIGRSVEFLDMLLRFSYPYSRVAPAYEKLKRHCDEMSSMLDNNISAQLDALITEDNYDPDDDAYMSKLMKYLNQLVRV